MIAAIVQALKANRVIGPTGAVRVMVATSLSTSGRGAEGLAASQRGDGGGSVLGGGLRVQGEAR